MLIYDILQFYWKIIVKVKKHYVYGLQGLCDLFGCSTATASRIKKSGAIDAAISQVGNTIVIDADLALDLLKVCKSREKSLRGGYKNGQTIKVKKNV